MVSIYGSIERRKIVPNKEKENEMPKAEHEHVIMEKPLPDILDQLAEEKAAKAVEAHVKEVNQRIASLEGRLNELQAENSKLQERVVGLEDRLEKVIEAIDSTLGDARQRFGEYLG